MRRVSKKRKIQIVFSGKAPSYVIFGIRMTSLIVAATLLYNLYIVMIRADKKFSLLSKAVVFNSAAMLICILGFAYKYGLRGVYFAVFLATLASWIYVKSKTDYRLRLVFHLKQALSLSKIGIPILIAGITYTILISVDKIMIIYIKPIKNDHFFINF